MDFIKMDLEKEQGVGVAVPDMVQEIVKGMPEFIQGIIGNAKTLSRTGLIKKKVKADNWNMIQMVENTGYKNNIIRVIYNTGKESEIRLNAGKNKKKNK